MTFASVYPTGRVRNARRLADTQERLYFSETLEPLFRVPLIHTSSWTPTKYVLVVGVMNQPGRCWAERVILLSTFVSLADSQYYCAVGADDP